MYPVTLNKAYPLDIQACQGTHALKAADWQEVYSSNDWVYSEDRYSTHPCGAASEKFIYWYDDDYGRPTLDYYDVLIGPDPFNSALKELKEHFENLELPF